MLPQERCHALSCVRKHLDEVRRHLPPVGIHNALRAADSAIHLTDDPVYLFLVQYYFYAQLQTFPHLLWANKNHAGG